MLPLVDIFLPYCLLPLLCNPWNDVRPFRTCNTGCILACILHSGVPIDRTIHICQRLCQTLLCIFHMSVLLCLLFLFPLAPFPFPLPFSPFPFATADASCPYQSCPISSGYAGSCDPTHVGTGFAPLWVVDCSQRFRCPSGKVSISGLYPPISISLQLALVPDSAH